MPAIDWNLLRTFLAIVEAGSISRAAAALKRTQPAVSTALKRLESQVGARLLVRTATVFTLTEAGALLYRECREVAATIGNIPSLLAENPSTLTGTLSITMASHIVSDIIDDALATMAGRYPQVTIDISLVTSAAVVSGVLDRSMNLGVCLASTLSPHLEYFHLYREFFGFYCGPRHRLFGRSDLKLDDLSGERAVSFKAFIKSDVTQTINDMHRRANLSLPFAGVTDHLEELRRMVTVGIGIGALPLHIMQRDVDEGWLWPLLTDQVATSIDVYLVSNPKAQLSRAENAFSSILKDRASTQTETERTYPPSYRKAPSPVTAPAGG